MNGVYIQNYFWTMLLINNQHCLMVSPQYLYFVNADRVFLHLDNQYKDNTHTWFMYKIK